MFAPLLNFPPVDRSLSLEHRQLERERIACADLARRDRRLELGPERAEAAVDAFRARTRHQLLTKRLAAGSEPGSGDSTIPAYLGKSGPFGQPLPPCAAGGRPGPVGVYSVHIGPGCVDLREHLGGHLRSRSGRGGKRRSAGVGQMSARSASSLTKSGVKLAAVKAAPTHMLSLTLPGAWRRALAGDALDDDPACAAAWLAGKARFLDALRRHLDKHHPGWGWLWFQEFQRRGAPHLHLLLDLPGDLPDDRWQAFLTWAVRAWNRAFRVPRPKRVGKRNPNPPAVWRDGRTSEDYVTNGVSLERCRIPDFRYAAKYAGKEGQKQAPFSGSWGRWWGAAGTFSEQLREARRGLAFVLDQVAAAAFCRSMAGAAAAISDRVAKRWDTWAESLEAATRGHTLDGEPCTDSLQVRGHKLGRRAFLAHLGAPDAALGAVDDSWRIADPDPVTAAQFEEWLQAQVRAGSGIADLRSQRFASPPGS